jgi:hypothetical protein
MAITRRQLGVGLLALGAGATATVAVVGPRRIESLVTGQSADQVRLWGYIGGEKLNFVRADNVRNLLMRRHGITLDARRAGSVEMVSDPTLTSQKPEWVWPASNVLIQLARSNGLNVRRDEIVFNSPIVVYSWSPVAEALVRRGYVEERAGVFYLLKPRELIADVVKGVTWRDYGLANLFGRVLVSSTDPSKSNSGFSFAGLVANLLAGDVANPETVSRDLETIASVFERMGYMESSSGTHWNSYLNEGMGGKPLLVGYESQLIEFILANPAQWKSLQSQAIRPVLLYPVPTVYSSHPIISLVEKADRLIGALTDPDLLEIAWNEHGFRGPLGRIGRSGPSVSGIAENVQSITPMPNASVMISLLERLARPGR